MSAPERATIPAQWKLCSVKLMVEMLMLLYSELIEFLNVCIYMSISEQLVRQPTIQIEVLPENSKCNPKVNKAGYDIRVVNEILQTTPKKLYSGKKRFYSKPHVKFSLLRAFNMFTILKQK